MPCSMTKSETLSQARMPRVVKASPFALFLETSCLASHPLDARRMSSSLSSGTSAHSALQYAK